MDGDAPVGRIALYVGNAAPVRVLPGLSAKVRLRSRGHARERLPNPLPGPDDPKGLSPK